MKSILMHIVLVTAFITVTVATSSTKAEVPSSYPLVYSQADSCTATALSRGAGVNGPMTTHNMDCLNCDFRINKVPAKDWPEGSKRPIYVLRQDYPQLVEEDRYIFCTIVTPAFIYVPSSPLHALICV